MHYYIDQELDFLAQHIRSLEDLAKMIHTVKLQATACTAFHSPHRKVLISQGPERRLWLN